MKDNIFIDQGEIDSYSCLSLIWISGGQEFCSNYRDIRIIESILQGFLKDGDFTYVPIRERFGLERFGLERINCTWDINLSES